MTVKEEKNGAHILNQDTAHRQKNDFSYRKET